MIGSFLAAWTKMRRPTLLWATYAASAAVAVLVTTLTFVFADADGGGPPAPGGGSSSAALSTASGLLQGLSGSVSIFGIIALCVAAAAFAGEYTTGTLRNLLIRQPRRTHLLVGTWAAVVTFTLGAVLVAAVATAVAAPLLAGGQDIDTAAWFTAEGARVSGRTLGEVALASAGYATLGSCLGVLLRASIPSVAIGFGWLFLIETIVAGLVEGSSRWLPGQLLSAVASDGTAEIPVGTAAATVSAYLLVGAVGAWVSFIRRDVTA